MTMPDEIPAWKHFRLSDFACRCCGQNQMDHGFIDSLDKLREFVGFPLPVVSGYRCPKHNEAVSNTGPKGPHTTGFAVDLGVSRHRAWELLKVALDLGYSGIGVKQHGVQRFIHLDCLVEPHHAPRPTVWTY